METTANWREKRSNEGRKRNEWREDEEKKEEGEGEAVVKSESSCFIPTTAVEMLNVRLFGLIPVRKHWRQRQQHVGC